MVVIIEETFRLYPKAQSLTHAWTGIESKASNTNNWKELAQTSANEATPTEPSTAKGITTSEKEKNDSWTMEAVKAGKVGVGGKEYPAGATFINCLAVSLHASVKSAKAKDIKVSGAPRAGIKIECE